MCLKATWGSCNKLNKDLKMAHIKKIFKKCILIHYVYISYTLPAEAEAAGLWTTLENQGHKPEPERLSLQ